MFYREETASCPGNPLLAIRCGDERQTHAASTLHLPIRRGQTTANLANALCNIAGQVLTASLPNKGAICLVTMQRVHTLRTF